MNEKNIYISYNISIIIYMYKNDKKVLVFFSIKNKFLSI